MLTVKKEVLLSLLVGTFSLGGMDQLQKSEVQEQSEIEKLPREVGAYVTQFLGYESPLTLKAMVFYEAIFSTAKDRVAIPNGAQMTILDTKTGSELKKYDHITKYKVVVVVWNQETRKKSKKIIIERDNIASSQVIIFDLDTFKTELVFRDALLGELSHDEQKCFLRAFTRNSYELSHPEAILLVNLDTRKSCSLNIDPVITENGELTQGFGFNADSDKFYYISPGRRLCIQNVVTFEAAHWVLDEPPYSQGGNNSFYFPKSRTMYNLRTDKKLRFNEKPDFFAFSHDGTTFLFQVGTVLRLYSCATGSLLWERDYQGTPLRDPYFSSDDGMIVLDGYNRGFTIIDANDSSKLFSSALQVNDADNVVGERVLCTNRGWSNSPFDAYLYDIKSKKELVKEERVRTYYFSADGSKCFFVVYTGDLKSMGITIYDTRTGTLLKRIDTGNIAPAHRPQFVLEDTRLFSVTYMDRTKRTYNIKTGKIAFEGAFVKPTLCKNEHFTLAQLLFLQRLYEARTHNRKLQEHGAEVFKTFQPHIQFLIRYLIGREKSENNPIKSLFG